MSSAISTAMTALRSNVAAMNVSAARIASGNTAAPDADALDALIDIAGVRQSFAANVAVVQTANDMDRSTFNLWA